MKFLRRSAPLAVLLAAAALVPSARAAKKPRVAVPVVRITFSSVPWLTPADSVAGLLEARGYHGTEAAAGDAEVVAEGRLFERAALVQGWLDEQSRLLRWVVTIQADDKRDGYPEMRRVYDDIVTESEAKYGARDSWSDRFAFPFEKGDGREGEALRTGDAAIRSSWVNREGDRLGIEMARRGDVVLTYECAGWAALEARVRQKKARDL